MYSFSLTCGSLGACLLVGLENDIKSLVSSLVGLVPVDLGPSEMEVRPRGDLRGGGGSAGGGPSVSSRRRPLTLATSRTLSRQYQRDKPITND